MTKAPLAPDDPRHGTDNGYKTYGCRCQPCITAGTATARVYEVARSDSLVRSLLDDQLAERRALTERHVAERNKAVAEAQGRVQRQRAKARLDKAQAAYEKAKKALEET